MVADIVRIDQRLKNQFEAARRLGRMQNEGWLSDDDAQMVMLEIINVAQRNAPNLAPSGIHTRLVWERNEARDAAYYADIRTARQQERMLAEVAEKAIRSHATEREVKIRIAQAAEDMDPLPEEDMLWRALRLAVWRVKNGR